MILQNHVLKKSMNYKIKSSEVVVEGLIKNEKKKERIMDMDDHGVIPGDRGGGRWRRA